MARAPLALDLLQVRTTTHFTGKSLFADDAERAPVPLVQPYDGGGQVDPVLRAPAPRPELLQVTDRQAALFRQPREHRPPRGVGQRAKDAVKLRRGLKVNH